MPLLFAYGINRFSHDMAELSIFPTIPVAQLVEYPLQGMGGQVFNPGLRHTKVVKNGTSYSSLGTQSYSIELGLISVTTRHRHDMTENLLKVTLNSNKQQQVSSLEFTESILYERLFWPGHKKMCCVPYANKNGADQPVHSRSLISALVFHCLDSMICILAITKVSRF